MFAHHSEQWRASFCAEPKTAAGEARELRNVQANNDKLQRDLDRRDKTLAEAASLLLLQKKFNALWEDEVK